MFPLRLRNAPVAPTPVPEMLKASALVVMFPCNSREAPKETTVPAATVPRPKPSLMLKVPALTVVTP